MPERTDAERLDFFQQLMNRNRSLSIEREELEPDEGGDVFLGVSIYDGEKGHFADFAGGGEDLREAIDDMMDKAAQPSEKPNV